MALEKKAGDVVVLEMKDLTSFTDYFVICSGGSTTHVRAIAEYVEESLLKDRKKLKPIGIEGLSGCKWVLMDYSDVVLHVFEEGTRDYYRLDRLWLDAPRIEVAESGEEKPAHQGSKKPV